MVRFRTIHIKQDWELLWHWVFPLIGARCRWKSVAAGLFPGLQIQGPFHLVPGQQARLKGRDCWIFSRSSKMAMANPVTRGSALSPGTRQEWNVVKLPTAVWNCTIATHCRLFILRVCWRQAKSQRWRSLATTTPRTVKDSEDWG